MAIFLIVIGMVFSCHGVMLAETIPTPAVTEVIATEDIFEEMLPETPTAPKREVLFQSEVKEIQSQIEAEQYSTVIYSLETLIAKIKAHQSKEIEVYFPKDVVGFTSKVWEGPVIDGGFGGKNYSMFSRGYQNENGDTIEVHAIYSDPAILEYISIIKTPRLLRALENTHVIKVKDTYKALEKTTDGHPYIEHNIVVNEELLVNVIFNGEGAKDIISDFYKNVDFQGLENYLKK